MNNQILCTLNPQMNSFKDHFTRFYNSAILHGVLITATSVPPWIISVSLKETPIGRSDQTFQPWNNGSRRVVKFICRTRSDPASVKGKDAAGVRTLDSGLSLDAICAVDKAPGIQGSGTVAEHTVYWMVEANWFFSRFMRWPRLTGLTVPDSKRILHLCTIRYWNESVTSAVVFCIIQGLNSCSLSVSTLRLHLSPNSNHLIRIPLNDSGASSPSIFPIILLETLKSPLTLA